jgi:uncharacterized protein YqgQ
VEKISKEMEVKMFSSLSTIDIESQIILNKVMYEKGSISNDMYAKANDILQRQLTESKRSDIITYNKMLQREGLCGITQN